MTTSTVPEDTQNGVDLADRLTLDDDVRRALAVVIDRLSPAERAAFVLHDIFGFPFDAVAELVGRTPAACRQLARRARISIRSGSVNAECPIAERHPWVLADQLKAAELTDRFITVCRGGDIRGLVDLLDPEVAGFAVVIGLPPRPTFRGAEEVAERVLQFFGPVAGVSLEPFLVENHPAVVARSCGNVVAILRLDVCCERIFHLHTIARPFRRLTR